MNVGKNPLRIGKRILRWENPTLNPPIAKKGPET